MAGDKVGELFVELRARMDGLSKDLGKAQRSTEAWGKRVSAGLSRAGGVLTAGLTAPLIGLGAAAVNASMTFNKAMANVASLIPGNVARVGELKSAVQSLAIETGKSTGDLADGLYQVVSAFGDTADSARILAISAKAAIGGVASTYESIDLISAVTKAYGDNSAAAVQKVADLGLLAVRLGKTTFPELASSIGRVTGQSVAMGISQEELFGIVATFSGVIGSTAETMTSFAAVLKSLQKPSAEMSKALQSMGYATGEAALEALGFSGVIQGLGKYSAETGVRIADLVQEQEALKLLLPAVSTQAENLVNNIRSMGTEADVAEKAFHAQMEELNKMGASYDRLKQAGTVALQQIGDALSEALDPKTIVELTDALRKATKAFADLSPETKATIIKAAAVVAALGPVLTIFAKVSAVVLGAGHSIKWVALTAIPWLLANVPKVAKAFGGWTPLGMIVTTVALAVKAFAYDDMWGQLKADTVNFGRYWADVFGRACKAILELQWAAQDTVEGVRRWLVGRFTAVVDSVKKQVDRVVGFFRSMYQRVVGGSYVPEMVEGVAKWMAALGSWAMVDPARAAVAQTTEAFKQLKDDVTSIVARLGTALRVNLAKEKLFGDDWDQMAADIQAYDAAIDSLLNSGMDSADPVMQTLVTRLKELQAEQAAATTATEEQTAQLQEQVPAIEETAEAVGDLTDELAAYQKQLADVLALSEDAGELWATAHGSEQSAAQKALTAHMQTTPLAGQVIGWEATKEVLEALVEYEATRTRILALDEDWIREAQQGTDEVTDSTGGLKDALGDINDFLSRKTLPAIRSLSDLAAAAFTGMKVSAEDAIGAIMGSLDKLGVKSNSIFGRVLGAVGAFFAGGGGPFGIISGIGKLFGLAEGGTIRSSGLAMVGERGPEIVNLPQAAQVTPLEGRMAGAGAGTQQTIIVQLDGRVIARTTAENFPALLRLYGAAR